MNLSRRAWMGGLIASAFAEGSPNVSFARDENGNKAKLWSDSDNWSSLQTLLDGAAHLTIPPGNWPISRTLVAKNSGQIIRGHGVERTTLRQYGSYSGPVFGVGAHPTWNAGGSAAHNVKLYGITFHQTINDSANQKCVWVYASNDFTAENVRVRGSSYEGLLTAADSLRATIRNSEAWDCGNGGPAYTLSTAGFNTQGPYLTLEDFRTKRCGQGVECGSTDQVIRRGHISEPGAGSPSLGINCGSATYGIYNTVIEDCIIDGYDDAIGCANGLGRLARVIIRRNKCYDTSGVGKPAIGFAGGKTTNNVEQPWQGPDTEGSYITDNEVHVYTPHGGAIIYNAGPEAADEVFGLEPLHMSGNRIYFHLDDSSDQTAPPIGYAGKITAICECYDNEIHGLENAPARGDIASFTSNNNPAVSGFPTFRYSGNRAYKPNGSRRAVSYMIEVS